MFIVLLKLSSNKAAAGEFMDGHNAWIARGFSDGVFQCVGSIMPAKGGAILALEENREKLEARINEDPFVENDVATPEIIEIDVKKTSPALEFLMP